MDIPEYPFPASSSGLTSLRPYPTPRQSVSPPFFSTRHHHPGHPKFPESSLTCPSIHCSVNKFFENHFFPLPETSLTCPWIDCSVNKFENHFFSLPSPSCPKLPLAATTNKWIFLGVAMNHPELFLVKFCTVGKFLNYKCNDFFCP